MKRRRPPPRLVVELPLEGRPRVYVDAATGEDAARLLGWITRTRHLDLDDTVRRALDRLREAA